MDPLAKYGLMAHSPRSVPNVPLLDLLESLVLMVLSSSLDRLKLNSELVLLMSRMLELLLLDPLVLSTRMVSIHSLMLLLLHMSSWMDPLAKYGLMAHSPRSVPNVPLLDLLESLVLMVLSSSLDRLKLNSVLVLLMSRMLELLLL